VEEEGDGDEKNRVLGKGVNMKLPPFASRVSTVLKRKAKSRLIQKEKNYFPGGKEGKTTLFEGRTRPLAGKKPRR